MARLRIGRLARLIARVRSRLARGDPADQVITGIDMHVNLLIERSEAAQQRKSGLQARAEKIASEHDDEGAGDGGSPAG